VLHSITLSYRRDRGDRCAGTSFHILGSGLRAISYQEGGRRVHEPDISSWPKTDLRSVPSDVRCWRKSGSRPVAERSRLLTDFVAKVGWDR
jgi:hypothetical protein